MKDVILHAFNWRYQDIASRAGEIARCGYGAVLFPPPMYSDENGSEWWQRYQPKDYRVLRSNLGRKADLVAAIQALQAVGVRPYVDIVFNHMANESRPDHFEFPGRAELERYARERESFESDKLFGNLDEGFFDERDFHPGVDITDWSDDDQMVNRELSGLPDLVLSISVVKKQIEALRCLVALGFEGFRVDALKHLPVDHVTAVFQSKALSGKYVFGETLTFNNQQNNDFLWPIIQETTIPCYDFPLQQTLLRVFRTDGTMRDLVDPASRGMALPWDRALTFTVTHDVPNNDGFRGMLLDPHDEFLANAYILGRDGGVPMVYSDNGESTRKYPEDKGRWEGSWNRYDIAQMTGFHNAVQGMPERLLFSDDQFVVFARGDRGIVAINKSGNWANPSFSTWGLQRGRYRCQIHQFEMDLQGDVFGLAIPPRQAQMWLFEG